MPDCGFHSPDPPNARVWLCCVQLCHLTPVAHTERAPETEGPVTVQQLPIQEAK